MDQHVLVQRVLVELAVLSLLCSFVVASNPCTTVCGVRWNENFDVPRRLPSVDLFVNDIGMNPDCSEKGMEWARRAKAFLGVMGMNESRAANCSDVKSWKVDRTPHELVTYFDLQNEYLWYHFDASKNARRHALLRFEEQDPVDERLRCKIRTLLGFFEKSIFTQRISRLYLLHAPEVQKYCSSLFPGDGYFACLNLNSFVFQVMDWNSTSLVGFSMPSNGADFCRRSSSCNKFFAFNFTPDADIIRDVHSTSVLANLHLSHLTAAENALKAIELKMGEFKATLEDVSTSNIAILCLPLLMSLLPISIFEVPDFVVLYYAIFTDFFSALPLLIKSVELILMSRYYDFPGRDFESRIWAGDRYGVFETWVVSCDLMSSRRLLGRILLFVSLWFIVASTYAEYFLWRRSRFREKLIDSSLTEANVINASTCSEGLFSTKSKGKQSKFQRLTKLVVCELWTGSRKWITILSVSWFSTGPLPTLATDSLTRGTWRYYLFPASTLFAAFVHLYSSGTTVFSSKRDFLTGLVLGAFFGPLHLVLTCKSNLRWSERWHIVAKAANLGCTGSFLLLYLTFLGRFIPAWMVGCTFYSISVLMLHIVRSRRHDRSIWYLGIHSFLSAVVFGPFSLLFRNCFPETEGETKLEERLRTAGWSGFAFFITLVCFIKWVHE